MCATASSRPLVQDDVAPALGTAADRRSTALARLSRWPSFTTPVMYAAAVVGGHIVRFKLSAALTRAHRQNRGRAMTEAEAATFVKAERRAPALRRAR